MALTAAFSTPVVVYHVRICEVYDNNIVFSGADRTCQLLTNSRCASSPAGRSYVATFGDFTEDAVLTRVRLLNAAVEEEGNVGIFLCHGNSRLVFPWEARNSPSVFLISSFP